MFGLRPTNVCHDWTTVYPPEVGWVFRVVSCVGVALLIACAWWLWMHHSKPSNPLSILIGCFWIVVPPLFFLFEYFYIYPRWGRQDRLEYFKIGQELAGKCWAASLVLLYVCATGKLPGA